MTTDDFGGCTTELLTEQGDFLTMSLLFCEVGCSSREGKVMRTCGLLGSLGGMSGPICCGCLELVAGSILIAVGVSWPCMSKLHAAGLAVRNESDGGSANARFRRGLLSKTGGTGLFF